MVYSNAHGRFDSIIILTLLCPKFSTFVLLGSKILRDEKRYRQAVFINQDCIQRGAGSVGREQNENK